MSPHHRASLPSRGMQIVWQAGGFLWCTFLVGRAAVDRLHSSLQPSCRPTTALDRHLQARAAMSRTKNTHSLIAQSLFDHYSGQQSRAMTFPDEQQRAAYRQNRGSDYLVARGANPLTGMITPSVDLSADERSAGRRSPSPSRNSNPYPDLRPRRPRFVRAFNRPEPAPQLRPPRDDHFEALPLILDEESPDDLTEESTDADSNRSVVGYYYPEPLRGSGRRIQGSYSQTHGAKADEQLCCMNVPRRIHKSPREVESPIEESPRQPLKSPNSSRSASLPLLSTKLHLTPPASPRIDEDRAGGGDGGGTKNSTVPARKALPASACATDSNSKRASMLSQLWDKLPRIQLVHPSQAGTPKALRTRVPFAYKLPKQPKKKEPEKVEVNATEALFWLLVGFPGMLVWEIAQALQLATSAKDLKTLQARLKHPEKGIKEIVTLVVKLVVAVFLVCYLYRVLLKVWEVVLAILWPLELMWDLFWGVSGSIVRR